MLGFHGVKLRLNRDGHLPSPAALRKMMVHSTLDFSRVLPLAKCCLSMFVLVWLAACASNKPVGAAPKPDAQVPPSEPTKKKGRYSLLEDQGPEVDLDVSQIPNAVPKKELRTIAGNVSPYTVLGKTYHVQFNAAEYSEVGLASWYGKKFHGERTSNGEIYNMFAMTAAHKALPIPCYVRVTNLANNKQVIVRVNDRGPFHENRVIDLTYTAAKKLDFHRAGTAKVRVDVINLNDFAPLRLTAVKSESPAKILGAPAGNAGIAKAPVAAVTGSSKVIKTQVDQSKAPQTTAARGPSPPVTKPTSVVFAPVYLQVGAFTAQAGASELQKSLKNHTKLPIVLMPVTDKKIFRVLIGPISNPNEMQALKQTLIEKKLSTPYVVQLEGGSK